MSVRDYVTVRVGGHLFGIEALSIQDVFYPRNITPVPLAAHEILGVLNLRGRIVTAIDMRRRLGMTPREPGEAFMCVIVERMGELYALLVDDVSDVLWLSPGSFEPTPVTLSAHWRSLCDGLYRLDGELLLALNTWRNTIRYGCTVIILLHIHCQYIGGNRIH